MLPPARIVEKIAGERRAPVFEHTYERAARDLRRDVLFKGKRQTEAVDGGANHQVCVIHYERPAHINDQGFAVFLELPAIRPGGTAAQVDTSVAR